MKYKTLLVEKPIECTNCGQALVIGDIMYQEEYRGDVVCGYCKESYEEDVIVTEGENGRKLK